MTGAHLFPRNVSGGRRTWAHFDTCEAGKISRQLQASGYGVFGRPAPEFQSARRLAKRMASSWTRSFAPSHSDSGLVNATVGITVHGREAHASFGQIGFGLFQPVYIHREITRKPAAFHTTGLPDRESGAGRLEFGPRRRL